MQVLVLQPASADALSCPAFLRCCQNIMARASSEGVPLLSLAEEWLLAVSRGGLHITDATSFARARTAEGGADANTVALASCTGTSAERQLHSWVRCQPWRDILPQLYTYKAPMIKKGQKVEGTAFGLLPHEVFGRLAERAPTVFEELFGSIGEREKYWAEMERTVKEATPGHRALEHRDWLQGHPCMWAPARHRIPLGMHGDGGQMHGGEKVMVVSWGGLCRKGSTLDTRLLFVVLKDSEQDHDGHATLFRAFQVLAWSFQALVKGKYPACDELGLPFAGRDPLRAALGGKPLAAQPDGHLCGAWCELRGDWQFLRDALHLQHHYGAREMCHLCAASQHEGAYDYRNFSLNGPLRETLVGPRAHGHRKWATKAPISPLVNIPGFSIWRCTFDLMHTLELGILQRVVPAALQGLLGLAPGGRGAAAEASVWAGRSKIARCKAATEAYQAWADSHGVSTSARVKKITHNWVHGQWPAISQEHAKAAALRAMLPWMAELSGSRASQSHEAYLRAQCLQGLAAMDAVYSRKPRFLTVAQEAEARGHCLNALQALAELARLMPDGPWRLAPKAHALMHLACDSVLGNPRVAHCYQDEDFIGRVKRLYVACHGKTAPMRALQRYAMGTAIALTAREQFLQGKRRAKMAPPPGGPLRRAAAVPDAAQVEWDRGLKRGRGRPGVPTVKRPRGRPACRS